MSDLMRQQWGQVIADWRALDTATPWVDYPVVILGPAGGPGSTRPRAATYEVYVDGRLVASRPRLIEAQEYVEQRRPGITWRTVKSEPLKVVHHHFGPTSEFGSPTTFWVGE